jgi:hypothetical protein
VEADHFGLRFLDQRAEAFVEWHAVGLRYRRSGIEAELAIVRRQQRAP